MVVYCLFLKGFIFYKMKLCLCSHFMLIFMLIISLLIIIMDLVLWFVFLSWKNVFVSLIHSYFYRDSVIFENYFLNLIFLYFLNRRNHLQNRSLFEYLISRIIFEALFLNFHSKTPFYIKTLFILNNKFKFIKY